VGKIKLNPFKCPVCGDSTTVELEIEESILDEAKRFPMMIATKCSKKHDLIAFVDKEKQICDVEKAVTATKEEKDAIEKTKDYFEDF
jgi:hypothetical protein